MVGCAKFGAAFEQLIGHEGAYSNDPRDPGGETKWGITRRTWKATGGTDEGFDQMTVHDAEAWYHDHFWVRYGYERVEHPRLAAALFNLAVNTGPGTAHRFAQKALNRLTAPVEIAVDGVLGPVTRGALNRYPHPRALVMAIKVEAALHYYAQRRHEFLNGWLNRLESL